MIKGTMVYLSTEVYLNKVTDS